MKPPSEEYRVGLPGHPVRQELEEEWGVRQWQKLGVGGFSEVWHVVVDGAHIALKLSREPVNQQDIVLREPKVFRLPMVREHPLVVSYFGQWEVQGHLVTRWELGDRTLEILLKKTGTRLSRDVLLGENRYPPGYMWQVASVLDFLFPPGSERGVQHRDVKPANLVLFSGGYVKLGDMGLAKVIDGSPGSSGTWISGGTPGFAPPETIRPGRHPTWDLYGLAATYVRLRTGKAPFGEVRVDISERQDKCDFVTEGLEADELEPLRRVLTRDPESRPRDGAQAFLKSLRGRRAAVSLPPPRPASAFEDQIVPIDAGRFQMGSPEAEKKRGPDEHQHPVHITRPFCVGVSPVTVRQFEEFTEANPAYMAEAKRHVEGRWKWQQDEYVPAPGATWRKPGFRQKPECPVVLVSWKDCQAYCEWLTKKEGREFRLLTEAEWEYVCRGGARTYQVFGVGETLSSTQANFNGRSPHGLHLLGETLGRTSEVGKYALNGWSVTDMHGNVWEWCQDRFADDYYRHSPSDDPQGPRTGNFRVLRGGGWESSGAQCRSAFRHHANPEHRFNTVGFRVMRVID